MKTLQIRSDKYINAFGKDEIDENDFYNAFINRSELFKSVGVTSDSIERIRCLARDFILLYLKDKPSLNDISILFRKLVELTDILVFDDYEGQPSTEEIFDTVFDWIFLIKVEVPNNGYDYYKVHLKDSDVCYKTYINEGIVASHFKVFGVKQVGNKEGIEIFPGRSIKDILFIDIGIDLNKIVEFYIENYKSPKYYFEEYHYIDSIGGMRYFYRSICYNTLMLMKSKYNLSKEPLFLNWFVPHQLPILVPHKPFNNFVMEFFDISTVLEYDVLAIHDESVLNNLKLRRYCESSLCVQFNTVFDFLLMRDLNESVTRLVVTDKWLTDEQYKKIKCGTKLYYL